MAKVVAPPNEMIEAWLTFTRTSVESTRLGYFTRYARSD
jgi:hypothetical protein